MHVLNVNMTLDLVAGGGTAERTLQMSRFLAKKGVQCTVLSTDAGWSTALAKEYEGVEVVLLACWWKRFYIPLLTLQRVRSIVEQADIIHLMNHWTLLNALVYAYARHLRKPYVVCPAGSLMIYGRSKFFKQLYQLVIGQKILKQAAQCIAVTEKERAQLELQGIAPDRITVIPNGIDIGRYAGQDGAAFRTRHGLGDRPFVLFMGRLNKIKGPDLLLQAFCKLGHQFNGYHLVFAGPDEGMLSKLQAMVSLRRVESRVHFIGFVGGDEKVGAYHVADLIVVPSRQEAMSIVVLEAGASGKPVLLTDQCGFDEVAKVNGGYVVPVSVDGLCDGLQSMLADPEQLKTMGKNLHQLVSRKYTWAGLASVYVLLYDEILKNLIHFQHACPWNR